MRSATCISLSITALMLSACGGGSGGSVASAPPPPAPAPSPSPSPTPAPPPASTTYSSADGVNAAVSDPVTPTQSFAALGTTSAPDKVRMVAASEITIGRDSNGGYAITVPVVTANGSEAVRTLQFAANTRYVDPQFNPDGTSFAARQDASSTARSGDRVLYLAGTGGFAHLTLAEMNLCNSASGTGCVGGSSPAKLMLVFGQATPLADIPVSGSASYGGRFTTFSGSENLAGNMLISVDFASRGLSGKLTDVGTFDSSCDTVICSASFADFGLTGMIAANGSLSGTIAPPAETRFSDGTWTGLFFGPAAAELGGSMLIDANGGAATYAGVFGAKKQ